jgi:hypothetical protein
MSSNCKAGILALGVVLFISACAVSGGAVYDGSAGYVGDYYDPYCCGYGGWGGWGGWGGGDHGHYHVGPPGPGSGGPRGGGGRPAGGGHSAPSIPSGPRGGGGGHSHR